MRKKIITLATGAIMVTLAITASFLELINKDVLVGALLAIILPICLIVSYLNYTIKMETEKQLSKKTVVPAKNETVVTEEKSVYNPNLAKELAEVSLPRRGVFAS